MFLHIQFGGCSFCDTYYVSYYPAFQKFILILLLYKHQCWIEPCLKVRVFWRVRLGSKIWFAEKTIRLGMVQISVFPEFWPRFGLFWVKTKSQVRPYFCEVRVGSISIVRVWKKVSGSEWFKFEPSLASSKLGIFEFDSTLILHMYIYYTLS